MYLIDTNVISELRKKSRINSGVKAFFQQPKTVYISVITLGELRRGVDLIKYRGDIQQAQLLENWLQIILKDYKNNILDFGIEETQVWGHLRVPHYENSIDKQISATALTHDLILVTRNIRDFASIQGLSLFNPFK